MLAVLWVHTFFLFTTPLPESHRLTWSPLVVGANLLNTLSPTSLAGAFPYWGLLVIVGGYTLIRRKPLLVFLMLGAILTAMYARVEGGASELVFRPASRHPSGVKSAEEPRRWGVWTGLESLPGTTADRQG